MFFSKNLIAYGICFGLLAGCSDDQTNPTYTIYKEGDHFSDREYEVIQVYGFGNNELLADEIVKMLNKEEPRKYSYRSD